MAISPYGLIGGQQSVLENLLKSQQMEKEVGQETGQQMGSMRREFQAESKKAQEAAEAELQKAFQESASSKRRRKNRGLLGNLLSFVMPGLGSALGALFSGFDSYEQAKSRKGHAIQQAIAAKAAGKMRQDRWGTSFLGEQAQDVESQIGKVADLAKSQAEKLSSKDMREAAMKAGMMTGVSSLAMGKAMKGLGKGFKKLRKFKGKKGFFGKGTLKRQGLGGIKGKQAMKGLEKELTALTTDPSKEMMKKTILGAKTGQSVKPIFEVEGMPIHDPSQIAKVSKTRIHPGSLGLSEEGLRTFQRLKPHQLEMIMDEGFPSPFIEAGGETTGLKLGGKDRNLLQTLLMGLGGLGSIYESTQDRD